MCALDTGDEGPYLGFLGEWTPLAGHEGEIGHTTHGILYQMWQVREWQRQ